MYSIEIDKQALKNLAKIPQAYQIKIREHINQLKENPFLLGTKKLIGSSNTYRLRVGIYRIIYDVQSKILHIRIITISHRKDAY